MSEKVMRESERDLRAALLKLVKYWEASIPPDWTENDDYAGGRYDATIDAAIDLSNVLLTN